MLSSLSGLVSRRTTKLLFVILLVFAAIVFFPGVTSRADDRERGVTYNYYTDDTYSEQCGYVSFSCGGGPTIWGEYSPYVIEERQTCYEEP